MVFKPSGGLLGLVLGIIVLLKDDAGGVFAIVGKAFLEFILQDLGVELPIHLSINLASKSNSLPQHAAPHHQRSTPELLSPLNQPVIQVLSWLFLPSDPKRLILVSSDHTTFFQSSTVQYWWARAKSILSFLCFLERKGLFFFTTAFNPLSHCELFVLREVG